MRSLPPDLIAGQPRAPRLALTPTEAAAALGVSEEFLEREILPSLRISVVTGRRLVPVAELERWLMSEVAPSGQVAAPILTLEEAAARVRVSPRTVLRAIRAGHLVASQLNPGRGGWRIYASDVDDWMRARATRERAPRPVPQVRRVEPGSPNPPRRRPPPDTGGRLVP